MTPPKKYRRAIVWMRRTLRTRDNAALWHAVREADEVVPCVCLDDSDRYRFATPRRVFIRSALADLDHRLRRAGSRLYVRVGSPDDQIPAAVRAHNADAVFASAVYDPETLRRDRRIAARLAERGCDFLTFTNAVAFGGGEVLTTQGLPYRVFTPYRNAWLAKIGDLPPVLPFAGAIRSPGTAKGDISLRVFPGFERPGPGGGETAGLARLRSFLRSGVVRYGQTRDLPGVDGTSRLSPHLAQGTIGPRMVFRSTLERRERSSRGEKDQIDVFLSELIWREFYYSILYHFPHVINGAFRTEFNAIAWSFSRSLFAAWTDGRTGYPIIDAGMRQLKSEGWMHNRVRMIVASFLTKDLHIDWQRGERFFFHHLVDADWASNNGGWQWVAGTGTDASPWFRIFNPVLQGKKFDPRGIYVRRYLPELARVPDHGVHAPWTLAANEQRAAGCMVGVDYPLPIVDHAKERAVTLELYGQAGRGQAAQVQKKRSQR